MPYSYKRSLTIDHTKCGSANTSNCPVLVSLSNATFRSTVNGGHLTSASGYDLAFFSDSALTTPLSWELGVYTEATGTIIAWVKIPTVSASVDTVFYMAYGDAGISTFQSTATAAWDTNYKGVWHFQETSLADGATLADSTSNALTLTVNGGGTSVTGKIGNAISFNNGGNQYAQYGAFSSASCGVGDNVGNTTLEGWINLNQLFGSDSGFTPLFGRWRGSYPYGSDFMVVRSGGTVFGVEGVDGYGTADTLTACAVGDWHHLVMTFNNSAVLIYVDGTGEVNTGITNTPPTDHQWFVNRDSTYSSNCVYDELRLSNVVRSTSYITTQFNSQNAPSTFLALGSEASTVSGITAISHLFGFFDMGDFRI